MCRSGYGRSSVVPLCLATALLMIMAACGAAQPEPGAETNDLAGTVAALSAASEQQGAEIAAQGTEIAAQGTMISHLATRGPFVNTPIPPGAEPTPYRPVLGSVTIEGGSCCVGGTAGETVDLGVAFEARSPFGDVTEMRVALANVTFTEEELSEAEWQPFAGELTFPVNVALNWVDYYVSVQYRDEAGNLSPVYTDDISVEDSPG